MVFGCSFRPPEYQPDPNVFYATDHPDISDHLQEIHGVEGIPNKPDAFSIATGKEQPLLLENGPFVGIEHED